MSSPIIWGPNNTANNLQGALGFSNGAGPVIIAPASPVDPTVTAVSASKGSLYLNSTTGITYVKQDAGLTTNWLIMQSSTVVTNWTSYTATLSASFGISTQSLRYRRVGDTIQVSGTITCGTTTTGIGAVGLPSGLNIDVAKYAAAANYTQYLGRGQRAVSGGTSYPNVNTIAAVDSFLMCLDTTDTTTVYVSTQTVSDLFNQNTIGSFMSTGETMFIEFSAPIVGWSAADALIAPATVVAMTAHLTADSTIAIDTPITYDSVEYDTASAYNASTGEYTVPADGAYIISTVFQSNQAHNIVQLFLNGTSIGFLSQQYNANVSTSGTTAKNLVTGDVLTICPAATGIIAGVASTIIRNSFSVERIAPQGSGGGSGITRSVSSISAPTTLGAAALTDYVALVTGTTTVTLPTAVGNTNRYTVKNAGVATVTVAFTGGQTADGNATLTLVAPVSVDLISDNSNWSVI